MSSHRGGCRVVDEHASCKIYCFELEIWQEHFYFRFVASSRLRKDNLCLNLRIRFDRTVCIQLFFHNPAILFIERNAR